MEYAKPAISFERRREICEKIMLLRRNFETIFSCAEEVSVEKMLIDNQEWSTILDKLNIEKLAGYFNIRIESSILELQDWGLFIGSCYKLGIKTRNSNNEYKEYSINDCDYKTEETVISRLAIEFASDYLLTKKV